MWRDFILREFAKAYPKIELDAKYAVPQREEAYPQLLTDAKFVDELRNAG